MLPFAWQYYPPGRDHLDKVDLATELLEPYNAGADDGSNLVITGGTIFNAGAMPSSGCPERPWTPQPQSCDGKAHGIVVDYGYLTISGVDVRYNSGTAVIGAVHVILCLQMHNPFMNILTLRCGVTQSAQRRSSLVPIPMNQPLSDDAICLCSGCYTVG